MDLAAEELGNWMVRLKQNLQRHIEEWILPVTILKTLKRQKIALNAISAIFTNAMKGYPMVTSRSRNLGRESMLCFQNTVVRPSMHIGAHSEKSYLIE